MKRTEELSGAELDWWVAKAEHITLDKYGVAVAVDDEEIHYLHYTDRYRYMPSTQWVIGGPILDKMRLSMIPITMGRYVVWGDGIPRHYGATLLEAAMRARVYAAFGEAVDDGLCDVQ